MITLLNGQMESKEVLLSRMNDDSFYYGELNKYALSSSSIKNLLQSPKKWRFSKMDGDSADLRVGKLLHAYILEPYKIDRFHFVSTKTAASKEYQEASAIYDEVFTQDDKEKAERLVWAFNSNPQAMELINGGRYEVPEIGEIGAFPFRAKADVLKDFELVDVKTTSGGLENFKWSAKKYGYDVQAFIYCSLFNIPFTGFKFLVIDKGTLDIGIFDISEEFYEEGRERTMRGIDLYLEWKDRDVNEYVLRGIL